MPSPSTDPLLYTAVRNGNVEVFKKLLDGESDPSVLNELFGTMFEFAIECGQEGIFRLLLERGAPVNGVAGKSAPLISALSRGRHGIARILIERGAGVEITWSGGNTPISAAIFAKDQELLALVLKQRKPAPIKGELVGLAAAFASLPMLVMLLEAGGAIDGVGQYGGETPLIRAAERGRSEIVAYLLEHGADLQARDSSQNTALLRAAAAGHVEVMRILLSAGAEPGAKNAQHLNALMLACKAGKYEAAKLLLERGAPPNEIEEIDGTTALTMAMAIAKAKNAEALVPLLLAYGAQERELHRPPPGTFVSIIDCVICAYLPPYKDLEQHEQPDELPLLETVHRDYRDLGRYTERTDIVRRCPSCNTYYHHDHYVDTEDAFATPPTMYQHLRRYNLLVLMETLQKLGKHEELAKVEALYPDVIERFRSVLKMDHVTLQPNILPYVVESVLDDLIAHENFSEIDLLLLRHPDARIGRETDENLTVLTGGTMKQSTYPRRDYVQRIADKLKQWLLA